MDKKHFIVDLIKHFLVALIVTIGTYFGVHSKFKDGHIGEIVAIATGLLVSLFIYVINHYLEINKERAKHRKNQLSIFSNIKSFIVNLPPQSFSNKSYLSDSKIGFIFDGSKASEEMFEKFKNSNPDKNIKYLSFKANESSSEEDNLNKLYKLLNSDLNGVVIILSNKLVLFNWLFTEFDEWSEKNSDLPCLFLKDKEIFNELECKDKAPQIYSVIKKYNFINYSHPASLSWQLFNRAIDRSFDWKNLASFNRQFGSLLIILTIVIFIFRENGQKTEFKDTVDSLKQTDKLNQQKLESDIKQTETQYSYKILLDQLRDQFINQHNLFDKTKFLSSEVPLTNNIGIGLWTDTIINGQKILYQFCWTEPQPQNMSYCRFASTKAIVSGAYNHKNTIIFWSTKNIKSPVLNCDGEKLGALVHFNDPKKYPIIVMDNATSDKDTIWYLAKSYEAFHDIICYWTSFNNKNIGICYTIKRSTEEIEIEPASFCKKIKEEFKDVKPQIMMPSVLRNTDLFNLAVEDTIPK